MASSLVCLDPPPFPMSSTNASPGRSLSTSSLSSRYSVDDSNVTVEDLDIMDGLVQDVRLLSHALNNLEATIESCGQSSVPQGVEPAAFCVQVHDGLTQTSATLKQLLDRYSFLRCSDVLSPAANLIHTVKGLKFDGDQSSANRDSFEQSICAINAVQAAVAERVGDYLTWEMSHYESSGLRFSHSTEDMNMISCGYQVKSDQSSMTGNSRGVKRRHSTFQQKPSKECFTTEQMDSILCSMDNGVDVAFGRAKAWSKYCKDILNFVQRRIALETDHAKQMHKLAEGTRAVIQEEEFLPLQSTFINSFKLEAEFYENCTDQMKRLYDYKFIQPLEARKNDHDKRRKELKMYWDRHLKQLNDTNEDLKKARLMFSQKDAVYKKARESSIKSELGADKNKVEKRQKTEEDAMLKRQQTVTQVQSLEARMAEKYQELDKCKIRILRELRELIYMCDQTTKACTVAYFQALSGLWAVPPIKYQSLSDTARDYVPGMEYMQFVRQLPQQPTMWKGGLSEDDLSLLPRFNNHRRGGLDVEPDQSTPSPADRIRRQKSISTPRSDVSRFYGPDDQEPDDTNSVSSTSEYYNGPKYDLRGTLTDPGYSDAALSHALHKVRLPSKCCHCDSYTFFQTVQCSECSMTWHKNCLSRMDVVCGPSAKKMASSPRRMSMFGVPLHKHLEDTETTVPLMIVKCIQELDKRGTRIKGLYRVCGVKSKIEKLCEDFERQEVDLSNVHPTNIASAIKLYLRQLPEPLLTDNLYTELVQLAKDFPVEHDSDDYFHTIVVSQLSHLINQLPKSNYDTLRYLVLHLKRMTWFESDNQMSATNLGIVFGPTLMWRDEEKAPLNSLLEAPLQTRVVELILQNAYEIFEVDLAEEKSKVDDGVAIPDVSQLSIRSYEDRSPPRDTQRIRKSATPDLLKSNRSAYDRSGESPPFSTSTGDIMLDTGSYSSVDVTRVVVDCCSPVSAWSNPSSSPNISRLPVSRRFSDDSLLAPSTSSQRSSSTPQSSPLSNVDASSYLSSGDQQSGDQKLHITVSERCVDCGSSPSHPPSNNNRRFERGRPIRRAASANRKSSPTGVCITVNKEEGETRRHRFLARGGQSMDYVSSDSSSSSGGRRSTNKTSLMEKKRGPPQRALTDTNLNKKVMALRHSQSQIISNKKPHLDNILSKNPEDLSYI